MTTPPHAPSSLFDRVRRMFGGAPDDGRLPATVSATRALELVQQGASLVDVRESSEWKSGHASRAVHIPLAQIERGAGRLTKDRPVVVVCGSGMRSRTGAKQLRSLGYDATSVSGGMAAWQRSGGDIRR